jgi:hypothetical protein
MLDDIKQIMIGQCSPVLMGVKPSALFPLHHTDCLDSLSVLLPPHISMFPVREHNGRLLVLLYDTAAVEKTLSLRAIRAFLSGLGYPAASVSPVLDYLKKRFEKDAFPHEVGLFLGYPVEDVSGFVRHKGQNYKLCGYWKVYGDVEQAKKLFRLYDLCRECMKWYLHYAASKTLKPA